MRSRLQMELDMLEGTHKGGDQALQKVEALEGGDDAYHIWIGGPPGSPYEGGRFVVKVLFPKFGYPYRPPLVTFETKIFHPHIQMHSGVIGGDFAMFKDPMAEDEVAAVEAAKADCRLTFADSMFSGSPVLEMMVVTLSGQKVDLAFDASPVELTVAHLRVAVEKKTGEAADCLLVHKGKELLHNYDSLSYYGITNDSVVTSTISYNFGDVFPRDWAPQKTVEDLLHLLEKGLASPAVFPSPRPTYMNAEAYEMLNTEPEKFRATAAEWSAKTYPFHPKSPLASPTGTPYYDNNVSDVRVQQPRHGHGPFVEEEDHAAKMYKRYMAEQRARKEKYGNR